MKSSTQIELKKDRIYVDKQKFYEELKVYCEKRDAVFEVWNREVFQPACELARKNGEPEPSLKNKYWKSEWLKVKPGPSEYIGKCILEIARHLVRRPNFYGYTYKEDFIGEAVMGCMKYLDNFDPKKSTNPFGYFTQLCWTFFVKIITDEKHQSVIKGGIMMQSMIDEFMTLDDEDDQFSVDDVVRNSHTFVQLAYDEKVKREEKDKEKKERREIEKTAEADKKNLSFLFA